MYTRTRNRVRGGTEHVVTVKELDDYHLFRLFSFQGDDVTGLSLSLLQWSNDVHGTMQPLRAERLEEGTLFQLLQAAGGARLVGRDVQSEHRQGSEPRQDW